MSSKFDPEQPPGPDNEWPTAEEFGEWLKADPKNAGAWARFLERAAQDESEPPELRQMAQRAVAKQREARCVQVVREKMLALTEVMQRPAGTMLAEDRLAEVNALMDEITDALLETPEPHRTSFLNCLLPLREMIRAIQLPED